MDIIAMKAGKKKFKDRIVVSTKGYVRNDISTTITERTSRVKQVAPCPFHSPRLAYLNMDVPSQTTGDLVTANAVTYGAAIEYDGAIYPVTFGGLALISLPPGGSVIADPVPISVAQGETYWVRTYAKVNAGEAFPTNFSGSSGQGEGYVDGANLTLYNSAAISAVNGAMTTTAAVIGTVLKPTVSVLLMGDSIIHGLKDYTAYLGYAYRFCDLNSFPHLNMGFPGERASSVAKNGKRLRQFLLPYVTHAIVEYSINDLINGGTDVTILADLQRIWNQLSRMGITVFQTTATPYSTSTDAFATTANQSVYNNTGFTGGAASRRNTLNRALRAATPPAPVKAVFDVASAVETAIESGIWIANGTAAYFTDDGLHPKGPGHDLMVPKLDAKLFTL